MGKFKKFIKSSLIIIIPLVLLGVIISFNDIISSGLFIAPVLLVISFTLPFFIIDFLVPEIDHNMEKINDQNKLAYQNKKFSRNIVVYSLTFAISIIIAYFIIPIILTSI